MPSIPSRSKGRTPPPLTVRWTIGAVSVHGFEALRLSVTGATRLFGDATRYVVCVNSMELDRARELTGPVPPHVEWRRSERSDIPRYLLAHFDEHLAEGTGWKFAPLFISAEGPELALDNDCILWRVPDAIARWLDSEGAHVLAEDVRVSLGRFTRECGDVPRNSGIRGTWTRRLGGVMRQLLADSPGPLTSELDEQGLQVAALQRAGPRPPLVVGTGDVSICSPFPPHQEHLGTCGAHFVGLNAHALPWDYYGRPATECIVEHWERLKGRVYDLVAQIDAAQGAMNCESGRSRST